ncbi:MAG: hypothetical protein KIT69_17580, partial [Propionibacteriaceae bacterium]|nr:hypothetical protein [Propionibacteriaceae bacterium]
MWHGDGSRQGLMPEPPVWLMVPVPADGQALRCPGEVAMREVPQPAPHRIEPVANRPLVVGAVPGQSPLVALTAATWAQAMGGSLHFGYADPTRIVDQEFADGTVRHSPLEPDREDDDWRRRRDQLQAQLADTLAGSAVTWELRYLAGRADRALTHLARAVGAS